MTTRNDITDYVAGGTQKHGLVYTRRCGWIDLGHAYPTGAQALWKDVQTTQTVADQSGWTTLSYRQSMGRWGIKDSSGGAYSIKAGLSAAEQRAVALGIFLSVSQQFEAKQSNWFYGRFTNSGFSDEDLVSNLVGFYRAVLPGTDYVLKCEPVPKADALKIWDGGGAVGKLKNYNLIPYLYEYDTRTSTASGRCAPLPNFLDTVQPAAPGTLFKTLP